MSDPVLRQLVEMSRYLGDPSRTCVILGEGNTSARIDDDTFYIKASGTSLSTIDADGFVAVSVSKALAVLEDPATTDVTMTEGLMAALVDERELRRPSAEVMFHAVFYAYPEYCFVGHTHPIFTNMLLCSKQAKEWASGRIYPDQVVVMGHKSVFIPYVDPGLVRVREVRKQVEWFLRDEAELPRAIMMQNHGMIAAGDSPETVTRITDIAEKSAQIIAGSAALGGPQFMNPRDIARIHVRSRRGNESPDSASTPVTLW